MRNNFFQKLAGFLLLLVFLFSYHKTFAARLVPCGTGTNDPCTLCHLIVGVKGLIDWGMAILITLSITAIAIAGVIYVISTGDTGLTSKAKSFVTSVIIGFSLTLCAWLIINVVLWIFSAQKGSDGYNLGLESKNWYTFTCNTTSSAFAGTATVESPASSFSCDNFTFQTSSIKSQCANGDASSSLQTLMICLKSKLGSAMTVNSISDDAGLQTCTTNYSQPPCAHTKGSCHYGGVAGGKSEAVDISTKTGLATSTIIAAANACGAGYYKDESSSANHVHVSTTACKNN